MDSASTQWSKEMLIAAIEQLRVNYFQYKDACIALMIVRYCNLLIPQTMSDREKTFWQRQAMHWQYCYQLAKQPR